MSTKDLRIGIVGARFNEFITRPLVEGAADTLLASGISEENIYRFWVPGAWEIPLICKRLLASKKVDAIIACACVIRGETGHYEIVANASSNGVAQVALEYSIPIMNAILTVENMEQALHRAGLKSGNKGREAASALLELLNVFTKAGI